MSVHKSIYHLKGWSENNRCVECIWIKINFYLNVKIRDIIRDGQANIMTLPKEAIVNVNVNYLKKNFCEYGVSL